MRDMSIKRWPISPSFLSLRNGKTEEDANYNEDGVYFVDYLRGFLADLSHDRHIQNALSLFQFVPDGFEPLDSNADEDSKDSFAASIRFNVPVYECVQRILKDRKIIRIESGTYVNNGRLCESFRRCERKDKSGFCGTTTEFCYRQDSLVGVFASDELESLNPTTERYRDVLSRIVSEVNKMLDDGICVHIEQVKRKERTRCYLHYTCPQSLFEEHIFPIYAKGNIVACLMLGQMARDAFNQDESFQLYRDQIEEDVFSVRIERLPSSKWSSKERTIIERIEVFEKRLEDRINHRSANYLNEEFEKIEVLFQNNVKQIDVKESLTFDNFFKYLSSAFSDISEITDSDKKGFIRMFAVPVDTTSHKLIPIGWTGSPNESFSDLCRVYFFKSDDDNFVELIDRASEGLLADYQEGDVIKSHTLIGNKISFIEWRRVPVVLKQDAQEDANNAYEKNLRSFFQLAMQCYAYIRGARLEFMLETTIRTTTHESAHFIQPALDVVENKLAVLPQEMVLPAYASEYLEFCSDFEKQKEDVTSALQLLDNINARPSMIFKQLELQKEEAQIFPLLYRVVMMMSERAKNNDMYIRYKQKEHYLPVTLDTTYISHAIFNLLDNAIKYAYDGSNIWVNMYPDKTHENVYIEITNYGIPIKDGDRIYDLFFRGNAAQGTNMSGMGIGMYLVKKICRAHGGDIRHTSDIISQMNIPVLFAMQQHYSLTNGMIESEISACEKECKRLSDIKQTVVNTSSFVKYPKMFQVRINQPTYRNMFIIKLPM